jgi:hypothetical protein
MPTPVSSFFRFVVGFSVFLTVSFGVTYTVNTISIKQEQERQTAAALQAMVGGKESSLWARLLSW